MKNLELKRERICPIIRRVLEVLFAAAVVMDCNSVYANLVESPFNLQKIALVLGGLLLICLGVEQRLRLMDFIKLGILPSFLVIAYTASLLIVMLVEPGFLGSYIKFFIIFLPMCIVLFQLYKENGSHFTLFYRVSDITVILAILSLIFWTLMVAVQKLEPNGTVNTLWGNELSLDTFCGLHFVREEQYEMFFGHKIIRNIGLFPESPMYDIILVTSFYTDLFLRERPYIGRTCLFFVTILTTFGTLAVMLSLLGIFLFACTVIKAKWRWTVFVGFGALVLAGILILLINKIRTGIGSYNAHLDDLVACLKAWFQYPLFGSGFENYRVIQEHMSEFRQYNTGITTSLGAVLAQGGIGLALVYILPYVSVLVNVFYRDRSRVACWGVGTLGLIVVSIFQYRFFMFLLLALGYSYMPSLPMIQERIQKDRNRKM